LAHDQQPHENQLDANTDVTVNDRHHHKVNLCTTSIPLNAIQSGIEPNYYNYSYSFLLTEIHSQEQMPVLLLFVKIFCINQNIVLYHKCVNSIQILSK